MDNYRKIEAVDAVAIIQAVHDTIAKVQARSPKKWVRCIKAGCVLDYISNSEHAYMVEGFLVVYALGFPWYTDELWLEEKLVLRVGPGGTFKDVTDFLAERARIEEAKWQGAGTALSLNDEALARLYTHAGFQREVITLVKET